MGLMSGMFTKKQSPYVNQQQVMDVRSRTSYRRGYNVAAILPGGVLHLDMQKTFPDARIWLPFNVLIVTNGSSCDLDIALDDLAPQNIRRVLAGTRLPIKGWAYQRITIYNLSAVAATVVPEVQLEVGSDGKK